MRKTSKLLRGDTDQSSAGSAGQIGDLVKVLTDLVRPKPLQDEAAPPPLHVKFRAPLTFKPGPPSSGSEHRIDDAAAAASIGASSTSERPVLKALPAPGEDEHAEAELEVPASSPL